MKYGLGIIIPLSCAAAIIVVIFFISQSGLIHSSIDNLGNNETIIYTTNQNHLVLQDCTTDSDGKGRIDISCPNYDLFHFSRDPPIVKSQWNGVQLTIDNGQYTMQYTTPTGTNQYSLVPYDTSSLQKITSSSNSIQKIIRSFESEKLTIGNIFHQTTQNTPTKEELYQYALKLINRDRLEHGVGPVTLDTLSSAQNHADDMLNAEYFSHWNTDGVKPYVTYTKLGGKGSVDENISITEAYCPTINCSPNYFDPFKQINESEYGMMYNDAASKWGHRDNIIDPEHTDVNIGIAYDNEKFYFVEHFENNIVKWQNIKSEGNQLHLVGTVPAGYSLFQIDVFEDPSPEHLTKFTLDNNQPYNLGYYDQGKFVGVMLPRPSAYSHYPECSHGRAILDTSKGEVCVDYVTYSNISTVPNGIDISPDVSKWSGSGLHTIYVILKKPNGKQIDASSITLEYLK